MFKLENTTGFTQSDCNLLNAAIAVLTERGIDEKNASDIVNNNWQPTGNTVESLVGGSSGNARLIAAELLEALQNAVHSLEWAKQVIKDIPPNSNYMETLQEARAVIARATGQE